MRNGVDVLESTSRARGLGANEHPADPGRHPFPSVYDTAFFQGFEKRCNYERVAFPQCVLGTVSLKPTMLSVSAELNPQRYFGDLKCCHGSHQGLIGLGPETGRFRTREAQTYPPPLCELIATMFINSFEMRSPLCPDLEEEENDELNNMGKIVDPEVGDRVPVAEVVVCWDEIERCRETARWTWRKAEHNNVLEGRAGLAAVGRLATDPNVIDQRALVISDSQVVVGAMSKGRSLIHIINYST